MYVLPLICPFACEELANSLRVDTNAGTANTAALNIHRRTPVRGL